MFPARFKLYHGAALRSARVKWLLHELVGDAFEVEHVDVYRAEQYDPKFLAINPNHAVPVLDITLETGETMHMLESAAMVALLADAFPEKGLAPSPSIFSLLRADYLQILHFAATIDMMLWQIRIHKDILPESEQDIRTIRRYESKFTNEIEPALKLRLERAPYICGERFSAADCLIAHCIMWARAYRLCGGQPSDRYLRRVAERPAYLSAFSDAPSDGAVVVAFPD
jgi:glutathione S-transferase